MKINKNRFLRHTGNILLLLGITSLVFGSVIAGWEIYLYTQTGGQVERSIWFVHPTQNQSAIAIIQDQYTSKNDQEVFSLVVHGIGELTETSTGGIWAQAAKGNQGVQVEILGAFEDIEVKEGYNAETKRFEPYFEVEFAPTGKKDVLWVAVALPNASRPVNIERIDDTHILINNTLNIYHSGLSGDPLTIDSAYKGGNIFEFYADLFIERSVSSGDPFVSAANLVDLANTDEIKLETFEWADNEKWVAETDTVEIQQRNNRNLIPLASESDLAAAVAKLSSESPMLLTSDSEKDALFARYNTTDDIIDKKLAEAIRKTVLQGLMFDFSNDSVTMLQRRSNYALYVAFDAWLNDSSTNAQQVYEFLARIQDHMDRIDEDPKYLAHGINLENYVLAYDFIEDFLSSSEKSEVEALLIKYADFVADYLPDCGDNNWELVVSSGVGMAGLKFKNAGYLLKMLEKTEHYLSENVRLEGGIYEGQQYIGYAFNAHKLVLMVMAREEGLGFPNYFKDDRLATVSQFSVRCSTPDGYYPLFEDAATSIEGLTNGFVMAPFFQGAERARLAGELVWLYQRIDVNATQTPIWKLILADYSIAPSIPELPPKTDPHPPYNGESYVALDSGLIMFRNCWEKNASYLTATAKSFPQSHTHPDELCFEFFGNGTRLLTMPGYPGWGLEHHEWTQQTEASNGGVLFSGEGQTHDSCLTGIVQWLRGRYVDYVQLLGDGIYAAKHNPIVGEHVIWVLPVAFGIGIIFIIVGRRLRMRLKQDS